MGKNYHVGKNPNYSCFWSVGNLKEKPILFYCAVARICGSPSPHVTAQIFLDLYIGERSSDTVAYTLKLS
jgi:hypothetical protein